MSSDFCVHLRTSTFSEMFEVSDNLSHFWLQSAHSAQTLRVDWLYFAKWMSKDVEPTAYCGGCGEFTVLTLTAWCSDRWVTGDNTIIGLLYLPLQMRTSALPSNVALCTAHYEKLPRLSLFFNMCLWALVSVEFTLFIHLCVVSLSDTLICCYIYKKWQFI